MYDSRFSIFTNPTTITTNTTVNGTPTNLLANYVGNHKLGTTDYGVGLHFIVYEPANGPFTVQFKVQVADDVSGSPGTFTDLGVVGQSEVNASGQFVINGVARPGLARDLIAARFRTAKPWFRVVATTTGMGGSASVKVKAFVADGTGSYIDANYHEHA